LQEFSFSNASSTPTLYLAECFTVHFEHNEMLNIRPGFYRAAYLACKYLQMFTALTRYRTRLFYPRHACRKCCSKINEPVE
jgi:hypothetical protein